jgi:NADP-dependent 3-hydroxy acid dehydrogenase YdfG
MSTVLAGKCALITGSNAGPDGDRAGACRRRMQSYQRHRAAGRSAARDALARFGAAAIYQSRHRDWRRSNGSSPRRRRFGGVDILVNNGWCALRAGRAPTPAGGNVVAVNLSAAFHLTRLAVPAMKRRSWGRIVNVSSIYGLIGAPDRVGYVTTKTALIGLTRAGARGRRHGHLQRDLSWNPADAGHFGPHRRTGCGGASARCRDAAISRGPTAKRALRRTESVAALIASQWPRRPRHHRRRAPGRWRLDCGVSRSAYSLD